MLRRYITFAQWIGKCQRDQGVVLIVMVHEGNLIPKKDLA